MAIEGPIQGFPEFQTPREELLAIARQLSWYHTLQLDETLRTPGVFDLESYVPYYLPLDDLSGLSCLEIGSGNGFWSFELEKRRAASMTALDIPDFFQTDFSIRFGKDSERPSQPSAPGDFGRQLRLAAVLMNSRLHYKLGSVYDIRPDTHGRFDLVFCGSMLMHLFGPLVALQRMAAVCTDAFLITTQTDLSLEPQCALSYLGHEIPYVHFLPSPTCLQAMLSSCGYEQVLRGPTFFLEFRDKANPMKIPHTFFIGLKNASTSALHLPRPGRVSSEAARAAIEVVSAPSHAEPGQPFDLTVRVRNLSDTAWFAPYPEQPILLTAGCNGPAPSPVAVADLLPGGLDTLVVMKCVAPIGEGTVTFSFSLSQGATRFQSASAPFGLPVRHAAVTPH